MSNTLLADGGLAPDQSSRAGNQHLSRKNLLFAGLGLAALMGAAGFGFQYWTTGRFVESTDDAYVGGDVTDLAPRVDGLVAQVAVIDNQYVHAGQLLVKIDDRDYRVALAKAQAEVAGDMATLRNLDANRVLELALIDEAKAAVSSALAANALAQANQSRYRVLANEQAGSVQASQTADAGSAEADADG